MVLPAKFMGMYRPATFPGLFFSPGLCLGQKKQFATLSDKFFISVFSAERRTPGTSLRLLLLKQALSVILFGRFTAMLSTGTHSASDRATPLLLTLQATEDGE